MRARVEWSRLPGVMIACWLGAASAGWAGGRIAVLVDPGGSERGNLQIAKWMERDLARVLERRGSYQARSLASRDQFVKGSGECLLDVRITRYNPGSKAARAIVGFGAGACSLDIHYEFSSPGGNVLLSRDDGCGSSMEWMRLARKLNENMLAAIQAAGGCAAGSEVELSRRANVRAVAAPPPAVSVVDVVPPAQPAVPPVTPPAVTPVAASGDPVEQLRQLDAMKKKKVLSESEYRQKRKQILDRL